MAILVSVHWPWIWSWLNSSIFIKMSLDLKTRLASVIEIKILWWRLQGCHSIFLFLFALVCSSVYEQKQDPPVDKEISSESVYMRLSFKRNFKFTHYYHPIFSKPDKNYQTGQLRLFFWIFILAAGARSNLLLGIHLYAMFLLSFLPTCCQVHL